METILADTAGFCFGVKRAVDCVYKEAAVGKIYTFGPIIHNKEVTDELEKKGVIIIDHIDDFNNVCNGKIILRSHGVAPEIYRILKAKNADYVDCTCPYVKKIHNIVASEVENENKIIIIGDANHPEVLGINGWA
jgi:4-hydroxy-3-methylbut-2-enyl diphosphate reductase